MEGRAMGNKKLNRTDLMLIFSRHSPQAFHYSLFTAKKIQSAVQSAKLEDKKILIIHGGAYYPDFGQERLDEETFEEYLNSVVLEQIGSDLQQQYIQDLRLVESKALFREGHYAKYYLALNVSHTIERFSFNLWLFGFEAEFYEQKKIQAIHDTDVSKAIQYIELSVKALAKETRGRDEVLVQQLMEISMSRQVDLIIVPRGNVHSYISSISETGDIFGNINVYTQPWTPSPMDRWITAQITGEAQREAERIAAIKELIYILKANQLKDLGEKELAAREQAITIVDSIPKNKIDTIARLFPRIKLSELEKIVGLSL
jgi:hypothetical protein